MKNKNGLLLAEETLKIVIALIALTFLVYFLTSLYLTRINEIQYEKAKNTLVDSSESLKATIENLQDGEEREHLINDPDSWNLLSFTGTTKPNLCAGNSCLCICKGSSKKIELQARKCDDKNQGICIPAEIDRDIKIKILKDTTKISMQKIGNRISISGIESTPSESETPSETKAKETTKTSFITNENSDVYVSEETGEQEEEGILTAGLNFIEQIYYGARDFFGGGKANVGEGGIAGVKG